MDEHPWLDRLNAWSARNYYHRYCRYIYAATAIVIGLLVVDRLAAHAWVRATFDAALWAWNFRSWRRWEAGRAAEIREYRRMTGG